MKYAVAQLEGALLDAAVAKAEGHNLEGMASQGEFSLDHRLYLRGEFGSHKQFSPSTEWSLAGPIIERERIDLSFVHQPDRWNEWGDDGEWPAKWTAKRSIHQQTGPTPLIAVMRCFVASKLGEEVDL